MLLDDLARPRVSRETRRLLLAATLALIVLWVLARLRFPDTPQPPNPVSPVLTQLAPPARFADLATEIEAVQRRIAPALMRAAGKGGRAVGAGLIAAWPLRDGVAFTIVPLHAIDAVRPSMLAVDPATGLALVPTSAAATPPPRTWTPDRLDVPRYLFSATVAAGRLLLVPAYVASLEPVESPAWAHEIWSVPASSGLAAGAFVFSAAGEWLGIATDADHQMAIVPAAALVDQAFGLLVQRGPPAADLGVRVQELTAPLSRMTASAAGVVVTWVDPAGAARALAVGDVIEQINGEPVSSPSVWRIRTSRLIANDAAMLRVRRGGTLLAIDVVAPAMTIPAPRSGVLGLTLSHEPGRGSRVSSVERGSAGDRSGLQPGDLITLAGTAAAPTPAQVRRVFAFAPDGRAIMVAVRRGADHQVIALGR